MHETSVDEAGDRWTLVGGRLLLPEPLPMDEWERRAVRQQQALLDAQRLIKV